MRRFVFRPYFNRFDAVGMLLCIPVWNYSAWWGIGFSFVVGFLSTAGQRPWSRRMPSVKSRPSPAMVKKLATMRRREIVKPDDPGTYLLSTEPTNIAIVNRGLVEREGERFSIYVLTDEGREIAIEHLKKEGIPYE